MKLQSQIILPLCELDWDITMDLIPQNISDVNGELNRINMLKNIMGYCHKNDFTNITPNEVEYIEYLFQSHVLNVING